MKQAAVRIYVIVVLGILIWSADVNGDCAAVTCVQPCVGGGFQSDLNGCPSCTCIPTPETPPPNPNIAPLAWLLGKWKSADALVHYPTMNNNVTYRGEMDFFHVGSPMIQFTFYSFTSKPQHREMGFLKMNPGTNAVVLLSVHNRGLTNIMEGTVIGEDIQLLSTSVVGPSFGLPMNVKSMTRRIRKVGNQLQEIVKMETFTTPLTTHLDGLYDKVQ